jgi:hypothetical protein
VTAPGEQIWTESEGVCTCDDEWIDCTVHVRCDENCRALTAPESGQEWRATAEHWRSHGFLGGCSHGH